MAENTNPLTPQQQELVKALQERGGKISLMVAGKTGTGKSTLINKFLGLTDPSNPIRLDDDAIQGAREGDDAESVTKSVSPYKAEKNGIVIECWDTPGFEDTTKHSPAEIIAQMSAKTNEKLDLLLYCIKYEIGGRVDDAHRRIIREIMLAFKSDIWQRAVFVMTMVNVTLPFASKHQYTTKLEKIGEKLREILKENGVPDDIASNVPLVTAGLEKGTLQHEDIEWTAKLLGHCLAKVDKKVVPSLLKVRYQKTFWTKVIGVIVGGVGVGAIGALLGAGAGALLGVPGGLPGIVAGATVGATSGTKVGGIIGAAGGGTAGGGLGYKIGQWIAKCDEVQRGLEVESEMKKSSLKNSERSEKDKKKV